MAYSEKQVRELLQKKKQRSIQYVEGIISDEGKVSPVEDSRNRLTIMIAAVAAVSIVAGLLLVFGRFFQSDLTGSVFIVTRGGQNVKLGLVEVRAITEREFLSFLQKEQPVIRRERADLVLCLISALAGQAASNAACWGATANGLPV